MIEPLNKPFSHQSKYHRKRLIYSNITVSYSSRQSLYVPIFMNSLLITTAHMI